MTEVTWRATKMRTKAGNFVDRAQQRRRERNDHQLFRADAPSRASKCEVGASYDTPPNEVKAVDCRGASRRTAVRRRPRPEVLIADFAASAIDYVIRVWTADFAADMRVRDRVRVARLLRVSSPRDHDPLSDPGEIPRRNAAATPTAARCRCAAVGRAVRTLTAISATELRRGARPALFGTGEIIVREGDPGASMFIVVRGDAAVSLAGTEGEVARLPRAISSGRCRC